MAELPTLDLRDLDRPTPCTAWNLGQLLRHLVSENRGFATNTAAFAAPDAYDRQIEVREFGVFPGRVAIGMHVVDFLVHGLDAAASIDAPYRPDHKSAANALAIASLWPDAPDSRRSGAARNTQVPVPVDALDFEPLLGPLGRSPSWTPPC